MDSYSPLPAWRRAERSTLKALVGAETEAAANFVEIAPLNIDSSGLPDSVRSGLIVLNWDIDDLSATAEKLMARKQKEAKKTEKGSDNNTWRTNVSKAAMQWLRKGKGLVASVKVSRFGNPVPKKEKKKELSQAALMALGNGTGVPHRAASAGPPVVCGKMELIRPFQK